jgi:hypothetical protein
MAFWVIAHGAIDSVSVLKVAVLRSVACCRRASSNLRTMFDRQQRHVRLVLRVLHHILGTSMQHTVSMRHLGGAWARLCARKEP